MFITTAALAIAGSLAFENRPICRKIMELGKANQIQFIEESEWPNADTRVYILKIDNNSTPDRLTIDSTYRREPTYTVELANGKRKTHSLAEFRAGTPFYLDRKLYVATGIARDIHGFARFIDFAAWRLDGTNMILICSQPGTSA